MAKALVLSILVMSFAIPIFFARDRREKRGLRRTLIAFGVFCAIYVFLVLVVAPRL
ncbi:MAG TPA: hypothetical protein VGH28_21635 [Polyangiaceae bacterium]|jgi:hypothetical protein